MSTKLMIYLILFVRITNLNLVECNSDKDCPSAYYCQIDEQDNPFFPIHLKNYIDSTNKRWCVQNKLSQIRGSDYFTILVMFIISIIITLTGLNSGFAHIIAIIQFLNFDIQQGLPLIQVTLFTSTGGKFLMDISKSHPDRQDLQLICWDVVVLGTPPLIIGSMIGVHWGSFSQDFVYYIIMVAVMINNFIIISLKQINYESNTNESMRHVQPKDELSMHFESEKSQNGNDDVGGDENENETNYSPMPKSVSTDIRGLAFSYDIQDDSILMFELDYGSCVLICISILSSLCLIVGYSYQSFCFTNTLILMGIFTLFNIILSWIALFKVYLNHKQNDDHNKFESNISKFDTCLWLQFVIFFWGIIVGYLGIGGTLILGPLMLQQIKLVPRVRGSTQNTMIFFGATCGLFYFGVKGMIQQDWALILGAVCLVSDISAKSIFEGIGKQIGSRRFLQILLGISFISIFITPAMSIQKFQNNQERIGQNVFKLNSYC